MNPHRISPRLATWSTRRQKNPRSIDPSREKHRGSSAPRKHNAHAQVGEQNYEERDVNMRLTQNSAGGVRCQSPSESLAASHSVRTCTPAGWSVGGDGRGSGSVGGLCRVRKEECGSSRRGWHRQQWMNVILDSGARPASAAPVMDPPRWPAILPTRFMGTRWSRSGTGPGPAPPGAGGPLH